MPELCVRVVNNDEEPLEGEKVTIFISHSFTPETWLEGFTDEDGRVSFDFEDGLSVRVYVRGSVELDGVEPDGEVTVCI